MVALTLTNLNSMTEESKPAKKSGGHAYGRRNKPLSTTAEQGELCIYAGHALGRFSSSSMRYDSHGTCTRCVASAREGRMSFDLNRLLKKYQKKALKFWSQVDITDPSDCWSWKGCINKRTQQPQFAWRRPGLSSSSQQHPQRVAMWLTWGDLGLVGVKTTCGNKYCCNPFHLIPQKVGVFVDHESYLDSFDLSVELHTLKQQVDDFVMEEALKNLEIDQGDEIDLKNAMMMGNEASFSERVSYAMATLLEGKHISQTEPDTPGLFRKPADNGEDYNGKDPYDSDNIDNLLD